MNNQTTLEILKNALSQSLDPKLIKKDNKNQAYIAGSAVIRQANRLFGFDGWSSRVLESYEISNTTNQKNMFIVVWFSRVQIKVRIGDKIVIHEDIATGKGISRDLPSAYDLAVKASATTALKRAFRKLGDQFGLALYKDSEVYEAPIMSEQELAQKKENLNYFYSLLEPYLDSETKAKTKVWIGTLKPEQLERATATIKAKIKEYKAKQQGGENEK